jgi:RNA polymerase sigma-70 factor, ECF subfamily
VSNFRRDLVDLLPRLRRFAMALTGGQADAEDLVQGAVERALKSQANFRPGTRMDSWMFRIVQNLWIDETRAQRRRNVEMDEALHVVGEDGRDVVKLRRQAAQAQSALATLPADQRAVVALVLIDGSSYKEAAQTLNVPIGTVMSRLARAHAAIIAQITDDDLAIRGFQS